MAGRQPRFYRGKPQNLDASKANIVEWGASPLNKALEKIVEPVPPRQTLPPPAAFSSDEWLHRGIQQAVDEGIPGGSLQERVTPPYLRSVADDREFLWNLQKLLESKGVHGLDPYGQNGLPQRGAFKATFSSGDNVVKFGDPGASEWEGAALPEGVWGVNALTDSFDYGPIHTEDNPYTPHSGLSVYLQPRTELVHPKWGSPLDDMLHHKTLSRALEKQGWMWTDDHRRNMAFLKGDDYNPVVIDGEVRPYGGMVEPPVGQRQNPPPGYGAPGAVPAPFVPPVQPDWYYSVLAPLLMSAAAGQQQQQQSNPLTGLTESY
jgi:hypothetical protein